MSYYDPEENIRRLKAGIVAAVKGNSTFFDDTLFPLIVVFSGKPDRADQSRILAFQKFVGDSISVRPQVAFVRPACIRVGFNFPDATDGLGKELLQLARTEAFKDVCSTLGVVQVICGGEHLRFPQRDFSLDYSLGSDAPAPH